MKPEELMIGDWVFNAHHEKNVQITPYDFFTHGHYPDGTQYITVSHSVVSGQDFEPIPITPEILEKNGFKKNDAGYKWFKADDKNYYFGFDSIYYDPEDNFLNITKEFSQDMSQLQVKGKYKYIHELQHAIKLCKIEKEIEL